MTQPDYYKYQFFMDIDLPWWQAVGRLRAMSNCSHNIASRRRAFN